MLLWWQQTMENITFKEFDIHTSTCTHQMCVNKGKMYSTIDGEYVCLTLFGPSDIS